MSEFYCLRFETPSNLEVQDPIFISPRNKEGPVIPPGIGFPFRRLLLLAGVRRRYSNQPLRGNSLKNVKIKVKVTLRLAVYRQSIRLGIKPLETHDQRFFLTEPFEVIVLM
jgi:hypothetical protein